MAITVGLRGNANGDCGVDIVYRQELRDDWDLARSGGSGRDIFTRETRCALHCGHPPRAQLGRVELWAA